MSVSEPKCAAGCVKFYGGEIRHDKHCVFYPESRTEMYDILKVQDAMKNDAIASTLQSNGGPIDGYDGVEYVMVTWEDFKALESAMTTSQKKKE